jgi:hypothetical protein
VNFKEESKEIDQTNEGLMKLEENIEKVSGL